mmetsp:Transcript_25221/g.58028  ORF Transcript_25221/g.58028 Transcript_25221/m.58028 type:complete len:180 (-) Transcript_25221:51-590(-)
MNIPGRGLRSRHLALLASCLLRVAIGVGWPECQEQNTVIRNAGNALFSNFQGFGATVGCFQDDCQNTDKFVASSMEACTKVCLSVLDCEWWVWGQEEGEQKCWLRKGDSGREPAQDWISGARSCHPPNQEPMVMGNVECWIDGFDYDTCCDPKHGPAGNSQCWDGLFNFDLCCFPREEL